MDTALIAIIAILVLVVLLAIAAIRIVQEYERGVIFRLGRVIAGAKGPGLFFIIPYIDRMVKVNLQTVTMNVPAQDVITRDNVTVRVDAVIYFKVMEPVKATVNIQNYIFGTSQVSQTTLRSVCGTAELDELLSERERLNSEIQRIVDDLTEPWGVKVELVEIKDVNLPNEIQRAMARQAEAERDRRAKIINAEGEFQAAQKLSDAAAVIAENPIAYQLRMLQTVTEVAAEKNSTLVLPIPVELLGPFRSAFPSEETVSVGGGDGHSRG
ncbi:MAG: slipin family protein [Nitriliruptorales bacterium]|nr:slipin family protein [Nitriliruptorales bacterium]